MVTRRAGTTMTTPARTASTSGSRRARRAKVVYDAVTDKSLTNLVGVYREQGFCGGCTGVAMNSDAYDAWVAADSAASPGRASRGRRGFCESGVYRAERRLHRGLLD